jgi:hypothetical protein
MARTKEQRDAEEAAKAAAEHASAAFVAFLAGVSQAAVSDALATTTCPRNADGSLSWPAIRDWAAREGRWFARPAAASEHGHAEMLAKYKALEAKREHEQRAGLLVARSDAERDHLRIVLSLRAALLALPEQIAPQIANLGTREAAAALRERMEWLCQQGQEGRFPIPAELVAAVDRLVAEYLTRAGAPA